MLAAHVTSFSAPGTVSSTLKFGEVSLPEPPTKDNVVVEIKAAGINVDDVALLQDTAGGGWFFHGKAPTISDPLIGGIEFAGVVKEIGPKVKGLKVGDKVAALQDIAVQKNPGCWAERTVSPEGHLIKFPNIPLTFVEAASTSMAALVSGDMYTRAYGTSDAKTKIAPTKGTKGKVVVVGASGGLGSVMVQLLAGRPERPHIVAVCSSANADRMKRLGADEIVDYKVGCFGTQLQESSMDFVFDFVGGKETEQDGRKVLRRGGKFITAVGPKQGIGDKVLTCSEWHGWMCGLLCNIFVGSCPCSKHGYEMAGGMPPLSEAVFNRVVVENNVRGEVATELPFTESAVRDGVARVASRHPGGKVVINMEMDRDH